MVNVTDIAPTDEDKINRYAQYDEDGNFLGYTYQQRDVGEVSNTPTAINRDLFNKLQGFDTNTTVFNSNGSITTTYSTGVLTTVFNSDGSITDTFVATNGQEISKTTTFNSDGSISEVIS